MPGKRARPLWRGEVGKGLRLQHLAGLLPYFSDSLLPRCVIGRTGKILGCRALLLLHDEQGHPLLATTHRGDLHLMLGAPTLLTRYETATLEAPLRRLVIDREGMAAEFLAKLTAEGRRVVTILRTEQYQGLASFTDVGAFLPLERDRMGQVTREVAPARFQLALPEQPGHSLPLTVALIRDWRYQVPIAPAEEDRPAYRYPPKDAQGRAWWMEGWQPTPSPSPPTEAKVIPIVTTAPDADPVALARLYRQRWPAQENILKDWLLPIGLEELQGTPRIYIGLPSDTPAPTVRARGQGWWLLMHGEDSSFSSDAPREVPGCFPSRLLQQVERQKQVKKFFFTLV